MFLSVFSDTKHVLLFCHGNLGCFVCSACWIFIFRVTVNFVPADVTVNFVPADVTVNFIPADVNVNCVPADITVNFIPAGISSSIAKNLTGGSFISKVLLANADALCAAASPLLEPDIPL